MNRFNNEAELLLGNVRDYFGDLNDFQIEENIPNLVSFLQKKSEPRTAMALFSELPAPAGLQAIKNTINLNEDLLEELHDNVSDALLQSFPWGKSGQGHKYWSKVYCEYYNDCKVEKKSQEKRRKS